MHHTLKKYQKSFVLLSGGLDSSTCLHIAMDYHRRNLGSVEAVSIDYGQRHIKETECAQAMCDVFGIKHTILDCKSFLTAKTLLTDQDAEMPNVSYDEIKGVSPTYVPFRNGFMLARLAAYAQEYVNSIQAKIDGPITERVAAGLGSHITTEDLCMIYFGAHAEDAKNHAYPDCTPEFIGSMANAIYIGSYRTIRLQAPLTYMTKAEVVEKGRNLEVPFNLTWSCYKGEEKHCGVCPTCRSRKDAFAIARVTDPTEYAA